MGTQYWLGREVSRRPPAHRTGGLVFECARAAPSVASSAATGLASTTAPAGLARASTAVRPRAASGIGPSGQASRMANSATSAPPQASA
jgi:hypothetical protein